MYNIGRGRNHKYRKLSRLGGTQGVGDMTWEEMGRKYEERVKTAKPESKRPKLDKDWENLIKSTDKLIWLFSVSNARVPAKR